MKGANWFNQEYYRSLADYDCVGWAEEWLKRNPEFLADLQRTLCLYRSDISRMDDCIKVITCGETCPLKRWGLRCCRLEQDKPLFFWLPQHNPQVLSLDAEFRAAEGKTVNLRQCTSLKAVLSVGEQERHLLFNEDARSFQVVVRGTHSLDSPIVPRCTLHGWDEFETKPLSLRRLCCLYRRGKLVKSLYPKERKSHRWIKMLRAWDGFQSGACHREIAAAIYGERAAREGWSEGYRTRVQRLIRSSARMINGGYLALLR